MLPATHDLKMPNPSCCVWASLLILCFLSASAIVAVMADGAQRVFDASQRDWRVRVSDQWDILGPFPIQAREQHYLSPSFPLNLSEPFDFDTKHPSAYADGGNVNWTTAHSNADGTLDISFPNIRWAALRATEGWAALQHHTVLRTSITVYPPTASALAGDAVDPPRLLVDLLQGSFFTIMPGGDDAHIASSVTPKWYMGNIYAMNRAPAQAVQLPLPPSTTVPTTYDLFVSGDYEIRLFGDPLFNRGRTGVPVLSLTLKVDVEPELSIPAVTRMPSHDVSCDLVNGWAFGDALGVGLRSQSGWWTVKNVSLFKEGSGITLELVDEIRIAPTQTRIAPIRLTQNASFDEPELQFSLHLISEDRSTTVDITLPLKHHKQWTSSDSPEDGIKASYFFATSMPTSFMVIPPQGENLGAPRPPVLALHGAGVDILSMPFWVQALPQQERSWVIAPTGRTAWGLDWHGPSARDAWGTVDALYAILQGREVWQPYALAEETRVLVLGHSNGGQGAWYLASRYPDRVVGVIPAAAYIKSQAYVPLTQSRSAHYIDPAVRAILESSLTPDDNDLFLSNLGELPILAIHGGDDENVPVWHTREAVSVLKTWYPHANVTYREDPGQPHWYPSVFNNEQVRDFIRTVLEREPANLQPPVPSEPISFTLTVSNPTESGSLHGWQIYQLVTPGRLAKLMVTIQGASVVVKTANVASFAIRHRALNSVSHLNIDGDDILLSNLIKNSSTDNAYFSQREGSWKPASYIGAKAPHPSGRMSNILLTGAPFMIVIDDRTSQQSLSAALRIAHNLNVYHKLDAAVLDGDEAKLKLKDPSQQSARVIVLGSPNNTLSRSMLVDGRTPFTYKESLQLNGRSLDISSSSLFLHPHPGDGDSLMLFMYAYNDDALERALRILPIRTGVPAPDWLVLGLAADVVGAAAVQGVGVWNNWDWDEAMSWF